MNVFDTKIQTSYSRLTDFVELKTKIMSRVESPPLWYDEAQNRIPRNGEPLPSLENTNFTAIITKQTEQLNGLTKSLSDLKEEIKELSDGPEKDEKCFQIACTRRNAAKVGLELISSCEKVFPFEGAIRGELLQFKGECLHEEGAAYATEIVFSTVIRRRDRPGHRPEKPSDDPLQLKSETEILRHVIEHKSSPNGITLSIEESKGILSDLELMESQVNEQRMSGVPYELGSMAFRKKLHDSMLEELVDETVKICGEVRSRDTIFGKAWKLFGDVIGEATFTLNERIAGFRREIEELDQLLMKRWGKVITTTPESQSLNGRRLRLVEVSRRVEQHKANLLKQLQKEILSLPDPKDKDEDNRRAALFEKIVQLQGDYQQMDADLFAKEVIYRARANQHSEEPQKAITDAERNKVIAIDDGFLYAGALRKLLSQNVREGSLTDAQAIAVTTELKALIEILFSKASAKRNRLEETRGELVGQKEYLQFWVQNLDKESRGIEETEQAKADIQGLGQQIESLHSELAEANKQVSQYAAWLSELGANSLLDHAESLYKKELSALQKAIENEGLTGNQILERTKSLQDKLKVFFQDIDKHQPLTKEQRARCKHLKEQAAEEIPLTLKAWRKEYRQRAPSLMQQKLVRLQEDLTNSSGTWKIPAPNRNDLLIAAINENGKALEKYRSILFTIERASNAFKSDQELSSEINQRLAICRQLFATLEERQKTLYQQYTDTHPPFAPTENYANGQILSWHDNRWGSLLFRKIPELPEKLRNHENKILEIRKEIKKLENQYIELIQHRQPVSSDQLKELGASQDAILNALRTAIRKESELRREKHEMMLENLTGLAGKLGRKRVEIEEKLVLINKSIRDTSALMETTENPLDVYRSKVILDEEQGKKIEQETQLAKIQLYLGQLAEGFDEEINLYAAIPDFKLNMGELVKKGISDKAKKLTTFSKENKPRNVEEFRMRWQVALLGYEWSKAMLEFTDVKGQSLSEAVSNLVKEFLAFADNHPHTAEALVTNIALTIDLLGEKSALDTLISGMHKRVVLRGINRGMGWNERVEPKLTQNDLKWVALAEMAAQFPKIATGVTAAKAFWTGFSEQGSLLKAIIKVTSTITQNTVVSAIVTQTNENYLEAVETTLRVVRGDSMGELLTARQRVVAAQLVGELSKAYFQPAAFLQGLTRGLQRVGARVNAAGLFEKSLRIGALVGVPILGLTASALLASTLGAAFAGFVALGAVSLGPLMIWQALNLAFPNTVRKADQLEREEWLKSNPEHLQKLREEQVRILQSLQTSGRVPSQVVKGEIIEKFVSKDDLIEFQNQVTIKFKAELDQRLDLYRKARGKVQPQQLISFYLDQEFKPFNEITRDKYSNIKELNLYLENWARLTFFEKWLKPKVEAACVSEFHVMIAHYGSPEKFAAVNNKAQKQLNKTSTMVENTVKAQMPVNRIAL